MGRPDSVGHAWASGLSIASDLPGIRRRHWRLDDYRNGEASGSVNRFFRFLAPSDPPTPPTRPGS
jgi:hypothetical protein